VQFLPEIVDRVVDDRNAVLAEQLHEGSSGHLGDFSRPADTQTLLTNLVDGPKTTKLCPQLGDVIACH
jgi:hypothetical protein